MCIRDRYSTLSFYFEHTPHLGTFRENSSNPCCTNSSRSALSRTHYTYQEQISGSILFSGVRKQGEHRRNLSWKNSSYSPGQITRERAWVRFNDRKFSHHAMRKPRYGQRLCRDIKEQRFFKTPPEEAWAYYR